MVFEPRRAAGAPARCQPPRSREDAIASCPIGSLPPTPSPIARRWRRSARRSAALAKPRRITATSSRCPGHDPAYALGKAQAQFSANRPTDALATLDDLQKQWPEFDSADAHLLYARALAEVGRVEEAIEEYHAVAGYFPGAEARVRYGMLLQLVGRSAEARVVFNELLIQMRRAPK